MYLAPVPDISRPRRYIVSVLFNPPDRTRSKRRLVALTVTLFGADAVQLDLYGESRTSPKSHCDRRLYTIGPLF